MDIFKSKYPLDRARQLDVLVSNQWISQAAVECLDRLADQYGCIAYDVGMFPSEGMDTILLTWNVYIDDVREGGRKRNSTIASMILSPDTVIFQDGVTGHLALTLQWDSTELSTVIEKYRTCRTQ